MAINKVVYGEQTLIDLTDSTLADPSELKKGVTAYDRSGTKLTGSGGDYVISYNENSAVGRAKVGSAKTGVPNYTPSGDVLQTMEELEFAMGGSVTLDLRSSGNTLYISQFFSPNIVTKTVATSAPVFSGNGVHFVIEEDNS